MNKETRDMMLLKSMLVTIPSLVIMMLLTFKIYDVFKVN